jgi:hypothetical protein
MNFGVHDHSVYTILFKHIFGVLEQSDPNSTLTEFFPDKIYVFKSGFARHIVQMRLHNKNYVTYQVAFCPACDAAQHVVYSQASIRFVIWLERKILGYTQLLVMLWQQMLQLITAIAGGAGQPQGQMPQGQPMAQAMPQDAGQPPMGDQGGM